MIDLQLWAIASAIIAAVVICVTCFLYFGNRERSFDEVYGESRALNILLDNNASSIDHHHAKSKQAGGGATGTAKDKKKKSVPSATVTRDTKKTEKKRDVDQPIAAESTTKKEETSKVDDKPTEIEDAYLSIASGNQGQPPLDNSTVPSKKKAKKEKPGAKKLTEVEETTENAVEMPALENIASNVLQPEVEAENTAPLQQKCTPNIEHGTNAQLVEPLALAPKKKKQKQHVTANVAAEKQTASVEEIALIASNTGDGGTPLNCSLKRFNLAPLTVEQQEIVATFYAEQGASIIDGPTEKTLLKRIEEKERLLALEKQRVATTLQTISSLNQELIAEKQRQSGTERSFKEQLVLMQGENQHLNQQLRDFQTQMTQKMQTYHQMENQLRQIRSADQNQNLQMQQLREENQRFKERITATEQEMAARNSEMQRIKQELMNRDNQIIRFEKQRTEFEQIRVLQDANVNQQVLETKNALINKEMECSKLDEELKILKQDYLTVEQELNAMKCKFDEEVQNLVQHQAVEIGTKQDLDRFATEIEDLKLAYKMETARNEKSRDDMERQLAERLREKDQFYNDILEDKESVMHRLHEENQNLRNQLDNLSYDREAAVDARHKALEQNLNIASKLEDELHQSQSELETLGTMLQKKDNVIAELESSLKQGVEIRTALEASLTSVKHELDGFKAKMTDTEELEATKQQLEHLDTTLARRNTTIKSLEERLTAQNVKSDERERRLVDLSKICDQLSIDNQKLVEQSKLVNASHALSPIANGHTSEIAGVIIDPGLLKANEVSLAHLNKLLIAKDADVARLKLDIDGLRTKNNTLREEKYKAVEAVQQMEKNVKSLIDKSEAKLRTDLSEIQNETRHKLSALLPIFEQSCKKKASYNEWLSEYQCQLKEALTATKSSVSNQQLEDEKFNKKLEELSQENIYLLTSNNNLKDLLRKTEKLLAELECSVEESESKNVNYENVIQKLKLDTYSCLQEQLKSSAQVELQLHSFKTLLEEEKKQRDALLKDIEERNKLLGKEKLTSKDLSAQVSKWKGMVKISQDAFKQEQDLADQLKAQLKAYQDGLSGGVLDELESCRKKLLQREQQLEKEMNINKQLNNKLASLGVSTPFTTSS